MIKKSSITCPNNACGRVFDKPLKAINLQKSSKDPYNACPYCLTEIIIAKIEKENPPENTEAIIPNEEPIQKESKAPCCKYHRGYLSEKEHKQQIPEECMVCAELIDCMHKK